MFSNGLKQPCAWVIWRPPHPRGLKPQVENTALDVLVTSLLGAHWKGQGNMKKDLYSMLITVLFTKAKTGAKTKVYIYEWTKKTWHKYKTKYYSCQARGSCLMNRLTNSYILRSYIRQPQLA